MKASWRARPRWSLGGASGMGLAMALAFASEGANVSIGSLLAGGSKADGEVVHMPGQEQMDNAISVIEAVGVDCLGVNLDVTSDESVESFYQATTARFGKVDILANAAGITAEQTIVGHSDALWAKVIDVNLTGTYRSIKRVLPGMIEHGWGRIINIASTAASVGAVTSGAYCASKAAVVGLTKCVALEGAPHGVTCNAISPTWVDTTFGRDWMSDIAEKQEHRTGSRSTSLRCGEDQSPGTSDLANRDRIAGPIPLQRRRQWDHHGGSQGVGRLTVVARRASDAAATFHLGHHCLEDGVEVADHRVIGFGHHRGLGVVVDGEDVLRGHHPHPMLDRPRDAASDIEVGGHPGPGLAHLIGVGSPPVVGDHPGAADRPTQEPGQFLENRENLLVNPRPGPH